MFLTTLNKFHIFRLKVFEQPQKRRDGESFREEEKLTKLTEKCH